MRPRLLVLTALLALLLPAHSTASGTGSLDSSPPPTLLVSVQLERDSTLTVARVEPSSLGIVRVIHEDGSQEFVANHRIRWIRDAEGRDRTSYVLDRGKSLGEAPVSIRYSAQRRGRTLRGSPLPTRKSFPVIRPCDRDRRRAGDSFRQGHQFLREPLPSGVRGRAGSELRRLGVCDRSDGGVTPRALLFVPPGRLV